MGFAHPCSEVTKYKDHTLTSHSGPKNLNSIAHFKWHNDQITSIEWDPEDESSLAVAGADNQVEIPSVFRF